jgi:hypothetical protein
MHHDGLEIGLGHTVLRDMTHTLLRVLLDNDAVFSGMPIPELAEVPYLDLAAGAGEPRVRLKDLFDRFPARALHAPARAGGIS